MRNKFFTIFGTPAGALALALAFTLALSACATGGPGKRDPNATPGSLTITGIPADYEGMFASAKLDSAAVGDETVIQNGEVTLPLYDYNATSGAYLGYTGSGSLGIELEIGASGFFGKKTLFVFKETVKFENGAAKAPLNNSVMAFRELTITITGIPSAYYNEQDNARIEIALASSSGYGGGKPPKGTFTSRYSGSVAVGDGFTLSLTDDGRWSGSSKKNYYTGGPIDVGITATTGDGSKHLVVFRGVVFRDGKATVSFAQGVRPR
jgi:hypothetical protein